jgi:3-oxoacyl-[acyl-carrier protein] reductase
MADPIKTVLVTGGSKGIGKACVQAVAAAGYAVAIHYNRDGASAGELAAAINASGGQARTLRFDISDRAQCRAVLAADIEAHGAYYGVIANAGIAMDNAFPSITDDEWDKVIHTNLDGFYNVLQPVIMPMVQTRKPGRVITMASVSGIIGNRGQVNYSASKAGIIGATKALAVEMGKRNITVNCIAPGIIETEMAKDVPLDMVLPTIPLRRMGKPEEVAALAVFLLSDAAAYITRQVISVNGGIV